MGVLIGTAKFLVHRHRAGVSFRRTRTIGRQSLYVDLPVFEGLFPAGGGPDRERLRQVHAERAFVEPFLRLLGAEEVEPTSGPRAARATRGPGSKRPRTKSPAAAVASPASGLTVLRRSDLRGPGRSAD
ncbi:MAG TPA: hypothetical protein VF590_10950 [Isosphaeraceae bacterium]|jgi:hypothetical protein